MEHNNLGSASPQENPAPNVQGESPNTPEAQAAPQPFVSVEAYAGEQESKRFHKAIAELHRAALFLAHAQERKGYGKGIPSETVEFIRKIGYQMPFAEELAIRENAFSRADAELARKAVAA